MKAIWQVFLLILGVTLLGLLLYYFIWKRAKRKNYAKSTSKFELEENYWKFLVAQDEKIAYIAIWVVNLVEAVNKTMRQKPHYEKMHNFKKMVHKEVLMILNSSTYYEVDRNNLVFSQLDDLLLKLSKSSPAKWKVTATELSFLALKKRVLIYQEQYPFIKEKIMDFNFDFLEVS